MLTPAQYDDWYHTPRGKWVGEREFCLLRTMLRAGAGSSLLDVGCGTGYFSRHFALNGLQVTGIDPDVAMIEYARSQAGEPEYLEGNAEQLPFADGSFDYTMAVTSLCFVAKPEQALNEMWRVCRKGLLLGLLNRHSVLYNRKHGHGGYGGARWDTRTEVERWMSGLQPAPRQAGFRTAIVFPGGTLLARILERLLCCYLPWGGFLAMYASKENIS